MLRNAAVFFGTSLKKTKNKKVLYGNGTFGARWLSN